MFPILLVTLLIKTSHSYKFLTYSPQFGNSHTNFIGRITDALVDAGHEVVMLSPVIDSTVGTAGTQKARVIEVPQCAFSAQTEYNMNEANGGLSAAWRESNDIAIIETFKPMVRSWIAQCNATLGHPNLIDMLKNEKFDAAYAESFDVCGYVIFHLLGISKFAVTQSMSQIEGGFHFMNIPSFPSYVPSMMGGVSGEKMSFFERVYNTEALLATLRHGESLKAEYQQLFDERLPHVPPVKDIMANASFVFLNSDPLVDFPKPTVSKIIDIGGISVHAGHKPLNESWSRILDLRQKTILISFGTYFKAHLMPSSYKSTIRKVAQRFPDITFLFKYEKPFDGISKGIPNLVESTWLPQHDLLFDPRLTAFITHGGQGSTTEGHAAGIPLICIPVTADQHRNAQEIKRNGVGIAIRKEELETTTTLTSAIEEIVSNPIYRKNARRIAEMMADRPFSMKDVFIRHMEFMVRHGPLRHMDHYGAKLNIIQYYSIDVFAYFALQYTFMFIAALACLISVFRVLSSFTVKVKAS